ncbi:MAG: hypothetical protein R2685_02580 [Candidatus Nitrosocosmicus sp.]|nr:hypothetical protein [Candidatus Nitrosocosmicus sp.]
MTLVTFASTLLIAILASIPSYNLVGAQLNDTQSQNDSNKTDYTGFHSNIEQIKGHIDMAAYNKFFNKSDLTLAHAEHPIAEVLSLITIPLTETNSEMNHTYYETLLSLATLAKENSTLIDFENQANESLNLSDDVIATVVPAAILGSSEHNASVIKDLLNTATSEYAEGVDANGLLGSIVEYQDGSAFIDRAYSLFNNTQNISNDTPVMTLLSTDFFNLTNSVNNLKDSSVINQLIAKINSELGGDDHTNDTTSQTGKHTSEDYISKIRGLLNDVIAAYEANDKVKAKELATTAYLDNFEFIEAPIGKELTAKGESLLREKLREQIDENVNLDEIKKTIADINIVLDESAAVLPN